MVSARGRRAERAAGVLALLAGFALFPSAPAEAIDLVSNMSAGTGMVRGPTYQAQSFRTGSDAIEYSLTGVRLRFGPTSPSPITVTPPGRPVPDGWDVSVKIRNDANGYPGTLVATLTGSAGLGVRTFTAPANTTLEADTTYWVSVNEGRDDTVVGPSGVTNDGESGLPGWTIGNAQWFRHSESDRWRASDGWAFGKWLPGHSTLMAIRGYAHTLSTPANVSASAGNERVTLSWAAVTGAAGYEYQHKTLPAGACGTTGYGSWRTATAGTSHVVTGLANGTRYCFRVRAKHAGHESSASTPVNATPANIAASTPPTVVSLSPADGATAVPTNGNLVITFSEPVRKGSGTIVIRPASGSDVAIAVTDRRVRVSGSTVTIDPAADLAEGAAYHVRIAAGAFEDLAGNAWDGIADADTWNFTTAATPPTVSRFGPADGATNTPENANLVLTFSEPVRKGSGTIILEGYIPSGHTHIGASRPTTAISVTDSQVRVNGNTVTIDPTDDLAAAAAYHVRIDAGAFEDLAGNAWDGIADADTWNFTTGRADTAAPTVITRSPADDATGVVPNTDLVLTFSEPVRKGIGGLGIVPVGAPGYTPLDRRRIRISSDGRTVTIDPPTDLAASTDYYVSIGYDAFQDRSRNAYAGTGGNDRTTWNFTTAAADTTAPTVSTYDPADGATNVWIDPRMPVVRLTFSEPVRKGSGNIVFRPVSGPDVAISVTDRRVSIENEGRTVAINTANELAESTAYHVRIATGAFEDLAGIDWAGIADATTWNFTTDGAPRIVGYGYRGDTYNHRDGSIVPVDTTLVLTFSEPVRKGSGNIVFRPASGPDVVIPVTSGQVSVSPFQLTKTRLVSVVTIDPAADLDHSTAYHVRIAPGAIEDLAGNDYAGIDDADRMTFTTAAVDTTAPTASAYRPADGATAVAVGANLYLYLSEPVRKGYGNIVIRPASGPDLTIPVTDGGVSVSGRTVTIDPAADLAGSTAYHVRVANGVFEDLASNAWAGIADATTWNFTTGAPDTTAPTASRFRPADGATEVPESANLVLTFSEPVRRGSGNIVIRPAQGADITIPVTDGQVSVSGRTVTIDPGGAGDGRGRRTAGLVGATAYQVRIANGAFEDLAGNAWAGIDDATTWNFTTVGPNLTCDFCKLQPADGATGVPVGADLVLVFDRPMRKGSGNIVIRPASGADITIPVTDSQVVADGVYQVTIDPAADLAPSTDYHVRIAKGAFEGLSNWGGGVWAGIADATTWNFTTAALDTTAPTVSTYSPADGATGVARNASLVLTFDEPVRTGNGDIVIRPAQGTDITIPVTDWRYVNVSDSRVTISPSAFDHTAYHVRIANGAFEDLSGNAWAGIADDSTWTFTITAPDTRAPSFSSAAVSETSLAVTMDEALAAADSLANSAFTVKRNGSSSGETLLWSPTISGRTVTLTLETAAAPTDTFTVSYDKPESGTANKLQDAAGNQTADFTDRAVARAPSLSTATVSGRTLVLTYDEALDTGSVPAASAYRVKVAGGSGAAPSSVTVSGSAVTLTLGTAVTHGQTVTVSYTKPGTNPVQDWAGNDAAALTDREVTYTTGDITAPTVSSFDPVDDATAVPTNANLVITFSEPVRKGVGAIHLSAPGISLSTLVSSSDVIVSGRTVTFNPSFDPSFFKLAGNTAYRVQITPGAFEDLAGNDFAGNNDWNFTTAAADTTAPTLSTATVSGTDLVLTYDETLDTGSVPAASAYRVKVAGGSGTAPSSVSISGSAVTLTLGTAVTHGQTVTVSYTKPGTNPVQDFAGNDAAALTDREVTNTTELTVSTYNPVDGATDVGVGQYLFLTFSEPVRKGSGNIVIRPASGPDITTPVTDSGVTISDRTVRINYIGRDSYLAAGTAYHVRIDAGAFEDLSGNNYAGIADNTTWNFTTGAAPAAVASVSADHLGSSLSASWDASSGATGYDIAYQASDATSWSTVVGNYTNTNTPTSLTVGGVDATKTYTVRVRAQNEFGKSAWTSSASARPPQGQTGAPTKPAGLAAAAGDGQVVLTWTAIPGTTGWEVRRRTRGTGEASDDWGAWSVIDGSGATTARHAVTDLANGVMAGFQVRAWSGTGAGKAYGPASEETRARPVSATGSLPTAPEGLTAEGRDGDVVLSWALNWTAHRWEYQQRTTGGSGTFGEWTPMDRSVMITTVYLVGGLANGTEYGFRVRAVNARGEGPASAEVRATPAAPVGGPAKPEVTAQARNHGVRLGWAANAEAAGWEYRVKVGSGGWGRWRGTGVASPGTATGYDVTVAAADVGVAHGFQVRAWSGSGANKTYGAASDAVWATPVQPPDTIGDAVDGPPVTVTLAAGPDWSAEGRVAEGGVATIRATRTGSTEGALSIPVAVNPRVETHPAEAGDYDARERYAIDFAHGEAEATLDIATYADPDGEDERFNVWMVRYELPGGVLPGNPHHVYVTIEDPDEPAGTPAAPDAVDAASIGVVHNGSSLSVSWDAPARATHYDVTYYAVGAAHARAAWSRAGTSLTITCDSRWPGQSRDCVSGGAAYSVGLRARNAGGESGWVYSLQPALQPQAPSLSVGDATAAEGPGATLDFAVTLSPAAAGPVTVDYATRDGTATAAAIDYLAASGTLTFAPGETEKTVRVVVMDDAHDEGSETMTLALSNASGATVSDATATGTITNADPLLRDWLARFGRAAAADAVTAVTARLETPRGAGSHLTLGGQRLSLDGAGSAGAALGLPADGPGAAAWSGGPSWDDPFGDPSGDVERTMSGRELLMGTSFRAVLGTDAGVQWTGWGQGASVSGFSSAGPVLSLSGEMATGSMGMDYERGDLLAGFAMTHSLGEGTAEGAGRSYVMGSTVTTMLPYVRYALTERVSAWGLAGTGSGSLTLDLDGGAPVRYGADLAMMLAAVGVRGDLLTPTEAGGFALAVKADGFWVRTASESVSTPGVGNLAGARADASRVRAVLDGSRTFALAGGATLTPSLELGVRHDGGDAETGTGVVLGAGLGWADPSRGLDMALRVQGLAAHTQDGYSEWSVSGALSLVPGGAGRGLSASLTPSWGVDSGGTERLWALPDASGLSANEDAEASSRLDGELGYGLPVFGGGFTGTPNIGFGLSDTAREVRMGWRLAPARGEGFELGLDVTRREAVNDGGTGSGAEHGVGLTLSARF